MREEDGRTSDNDKHLATEPTCDVQIGLFFLEYDLNNDQIPHTHAAQQTFPCFSLSRFIMKRIEICATCHGTSSVAFFAIVRNAPML